MMQTRRAGAEAALLGAPPCFIWGDGFVAGALAQEQEFVAAAPFLVDATFHQIKTQHENGRCRDQDKYRQAGSQPREISCHFMNQFRFSKR